MRKTIVAAVSALAIAATATPAGASHGRNGAFFGALAAGALVAAAVGANAYAASAPVCSVERHPILNRRGDVIGHRDVSVCH